MAERVEEEHKPSKLLPKLRYDTENFSLKFGWKI